MLFLGDDLLAWILLALGGALVAGNALALVKPPPRAKEGGLERAPMGRAFVMIAIGAVATIWALGSLLSG